MARPIATFTRSVLLSDMVEAGWLTDRHGEPWLDDYGDCIVCSPIAYRVLDDYICGIARLDDRPTGRNPLSYSLLLRIYCDSTLGTAIDARHVSGYYSIAERTARKYLYALRLLDKLLTNSINIEAKTNLPMNTVVYGLDEKKFKNVLALI